MFLRLAALATTIAALGCTKPEQPAVPAAAPPPAPETLQSVVAELNQICADTWCEGGYQFEFTRLECATAVSCSLTFVARRDGAASATPATIPLAGFEAVVSTGGASTVGFQTVVNDAIAEWETNAPSQ